MTDLNDPCPYKVGDCVVYRPTQKGADLLTMETEKLRPLTRYRVREIQNGKYVIVEGYNHPGGGIYWTEFSACDQNSPET